MGTQDVEIVKAGTVASIEAMPFSQWQLLSMEEQMYQVYLSTVSMQNKMIDLENQAQALTDPDKLMGMFTGFMGGGLS